MIKEKSEGLYKFKADNYDQAKWIPLSEIKKF